MSGSLILSLTIEDIKQALAQPLPGLTGQIGMAPTPQSYQIDRWIAPDDCRQAGVLILLYPHSKNDREPEFFLILTRRHEYPGVHSGQISLPGGRREDGETLQETALREATEEIGVLADTLQMTGRLSSLYTPPSNFCIYPFVAFSSTRPYFQPDSREVAELIEVPLTLLADRTIYKRETWHFEDYGEREVPFFDIYDHKVWGATAMILNEFLTLLRGRAK